MWFVHRTRFDCIVHFNYDNLHVNIATNRSVIQVNSGVLLCDLWDTNNRFQVEADEAVKAIELCQLNWSCGIESNI